MAMTLIAKIATRAKQLRAKSPSMTWQSALKKAGAEYRGTTVKTTSKRLTVKAKRGRPLKRTTIKKVGSNNFNEGDIVLVKPEKLKAEIIRLTNYGAFVKFIDRRPTGGDKRGMYQIKDLKSLGNMQKTGAVKKTPVSKHKDTKSHNVNIRVMSGAKKPKVQKADVDMNALNGVIKFQANKFYEVVKGANKGSVVKITSVRKPTKKTPELGLVTNYNVNFYEFRDGHLCKPFLGIITDRWLNKRSIRPRLSVKSTELKKYM